MRVESLVADRSLGYFPQGWVGTWSPGIGDPTVGGWLTVILYFVAAWRAFRTRRWLAVRARSERRTWWILGVLLVALGINKQLDLQSALTEFGRMLATEQGWYERRGEVQRTFIVVIALLFGAGMVGLVLAMRRAPKPTRVAVGGLCLVFAFVVIRAASFHHVDYFLRSVWLGVRVNWVLEIAGILIILIAAIWRERVSVGARTPAVVAVIQRLYSMSTAGLRSHRKR